LKHALKGKYHIKPMRQVLHDELLLDAFILSSPFLGSYVSDRLRKAIENHGLTAFNFESLSNLNDRMSVLPEPWPNYDNQ